MNRGVRALGISLVFGVLGAVVPMAASAYVFTFNPTHVDFGNRQYGTRTTAGITFTVSCAGMSDPDCAPGGGYAPERLAIAPDSYIQDNNCGSGSSGTMAPTPLMGVSCTITVTFSPLANGTINGVLYDTTSGSGTTLGGSGFGAPGSSSANPTATTTTKCKAKKKKKKKRAAEAKKKKKKKKCKKKKKKKKKG
jgi:hypothetical protein